MQFFALVAAAFAATAFAAPTAQTAPLDLIPSGGEYQPPAPTTNTGNQCSQTQHAACCNSASGTPAFGLDCAINILGGPCSGTVQCCEADGNGALIGAGLCIPISL